MSALTNDQQQRVRSRIEALGYDVPLLIDELTDHVSFVVEARMARGEPFNVAMSAAMQDLMAENSRKLQGQVIHSLMNERKVRRSMWTFAIAGAAGLALWVALEYVAFRLFGIAELGAAYGLLAQVILAVVLWLNFRKVSDIIGTRLHGRSMLAQGARISFHASTFFLIFLTFFWTGVDPEFYRGFQLPTDVILEPEQLLYTAAAGSFVGVLVSGLLISGVLTLVMRRRATNEGHRRDRGSRLAQQGGGLD